MKEVETPKLQNYKCGKHPIVEDDMFDGGFGESYHVICLTCYTKTNWCKSKHRAICRWNNKFIDKL